MERFPFPSPVTERLSPVGVIFVVACPRHDSVTQAHLRGRGVAPYQQGPGKGVSLSSSLEPWEATSAKYVSVYTRHVSIQQKVIYKLPKREQKNPSSINSSQCKNVYLIMTCYNSLPTANSCSLPVLWNRQFADPKNWQKIA